MNYSTKEKDSIKHGNMALILEILQREEKIVLSKLKASRDDQRYFQGSIGTLDEILELIS